MKFINFFVLACICLCSTGCATILRGKTQTITLQTNPPGARCDLLREGRIVGTIENTPGAITIEKTKHDMSVVCKKAGYMESSNFAESGSEGATFGNIIAGGLIGWGIDSASGADNKYPEVLTVNLTPDTNSKQQPERASKTPVAPRRSEVSRKLATLEQLRKDGSITDEEYKKKRAQIIDGL